MSSSAKLPPGFVALPDPMADGPEFTIIEYDRLTDGSVVEYRGPRDLKNAKGVHHIHAFCQGDSDDGPLSAVWSSAVLDRLLKQVPVGTLVFVRYDGLAPHPTLSEKTQHNWTVAVVTPDADAAA
jgi:hypothetical protein